MKEALAGKMSPERMDYLQSSMSEWAEHCSDTERRADEAEWACVDLKVAEYMEQFIGESFEGVISGVTSFGFFVELPNTVEGLVKYESLPEYYEFDRDGMTATGRRSGHMFEIGDTVKVIVHSVDRQLHKVEFVMDMGAGRRGAAKAVRKGRRPQRTSAGRKRR